MTRNTLIVAMAAAIMVLAGCYSSGVDRNWGRAQRINFAAQVKHPDAPTTLEEPSGMDAISGENALSAHRKRAVQKGEQQTPPSLISIGTGLGER